MIDESRFMCFNTIVHYLIFHKFSQNFLKTKRSFSNIKERVLLDMRRTEVSETDEGDWRARGKI